MIKSLRLSWMNTHCHMFVIIRAIFFEMLESFVSFFLFFIFIFTHVLFSCKIIFWSDYCYDWDRIFLRGEIYRLFTSILICNPSRFYENLTIFSFFLEMEKRNYPKRKSTLIFIIIVISFFIQTFSMIFRRISPNDALNAALFAFYSKFTIEDEFFINFINVPFQIVSVLMLLTFFSNFSLFIGYFIGSFVFYLFYILPVIINKPIFRTPNFLTIFDLD